MRRKVRTTALATVLAIMGALFLAAPAEADDGVNAQVDLHGCPTYTVCLWPAPGFPSNSIRVFDYSVFTSKACVPSLVPLYFTNRTQMNDAISSVINHTDLAIVLYENINYQGRFIYVNPFTQIGNLSDKRFPIFRQDGSFLATSDFDNVTSSIC
jgi:hypothetical protein